MTFLSLLVEVFLLPVRNCQEYSDDHCGEQLQIVGVDCQYADNELHHHVIDDSTNGDCQQLQTEVDKDLTKDHLTDDNGSQTNDNGTTAHVDLCKTLVLT